MKTQVNTFKEHLKRIKTAKDTTTLLEQMGLAEKSMSILWNQIFDLLCFNDPENDLRGIKELAGVLNKILTNYRQLFTITQKVCGSNHNEKAWEISESIFRDIEEQLQLL